MLTLLFLLPTLLFPLTIVLDPGHGGQFTGAIGVTQKVVEKSAALDVAWKLRPLLEASGFTVFLTRSHDQHLAVKLEDDLKARALVAKNARADLFVSLHFNTSAQPLEQGYQVYVPWRATPDLKSYTAALYVHHALAHQTSPLWAGSLGNLNKRDGGIRQAKFNVLMLCPCPALLVELEYLSSIEGEQLVAQESYRQQLVNVLHSGISDWRTSLVR